MTEIVAKEKLQDYIGKDLGYSQWVLVDQQRINGFADDTGDHQFIHIDPEKAAQTPFGSTIAHGFLTLSMISALMADINLIPEGTVMGINYGSDKVRFLAPVKVNSEVRAHAVVAEVAEKAPGQILIKSNVTVEIKGEDKPALVAEILTMFIVG
ncbi:MAG: MaoC family dehydratase [Pseudomonadales bacterium]